MYRHKQAQAIYLSRAERRVGQRRLWVGGGTRAFVVGHVLKSDRTGVSGCSMSGYMRLRARILTTFVRLCTPVRRGVTASEARTTRSASKRCKLARREARGGRATPSRADQRHRSTHTSARTNARSPSHDRGKT